MQPQHAQNTMTTITVRTSYLAVKNHLHYIYTHMHVCIGNNVA